MNVIPNVNTGDAAAPDPYRVGTPHALRNLAPLEAFTVPATQDAAPMSVPWTS
jgi:hypothetical protein